MGRQLKERANKVIDLVQVEKDPHRPGRLRVVEKGWGAAGDFGHGHDA